MIADPIANLIYIFVDAVDECEESSREGLHKYLTRLGTCPSDGRLRVLVTSRHEMQLNPTIREMGSITTTFEDMSNEGMKAYVGYQVGRLPPKFREFWNTS